MGTELDSIMTIESAPAGPELIITNPDVASDGFLSEAAVSVDTVTVEIVFTNHPEPDVIVLDVKNLGHPPKFRKGRALPVSASAHIAQQTDWRTYPLSRPTSSSQVPALAGVSMRWSGMPSFGISRATLWAMPSALGTALAAAGLALAAMMLTFPVGGF